MRKLVVALAAFAALLGVFAAAWFYAFARSNDGDAKVNATNAIVTASVQRGHIVAAILCLLLILGLWAFLFRGRRMFGAVKLESSPLRAPAIGMVVLLLVVAYGLSVPAIQNDLNMMLHETTGICRVILTIMLLALGSSVWQFLALRREHQAFLTVKGLSTPLDRSDPELPTKLERLFNLYAIGTLAEKWRNLKAAAAYADLADYETLMAFPDQREALRESKISFVIKALPLMGMVGTVAGFVIAMIGMLAAATHMADFNSFKGSMLSSLDGMSSSFLTTLSGMGAMLLVMFLNTLVAESRSRVMLLEDEYLYLHVYLPWRRRLEERTK